MKKFKFKLESVLSLRLHKERLVMQEVGALTQELDRVKGVMADLEVERVEVEQDLARRMGLGMSGAELQGVQSYIKGIVVRWQEEYALCEKVQRYLDAKRSELARCAVERKAMETLKDRQREAFIREQDEEQRKLDEETVLVHRAATARSRE
ncbi:flagellar export protein FliJ [Desulfoluna spongiiphila]|uniref:Flagellar FliJ protein n=1 Tax=Desulfoluna spongiiphila TaxID=419481 RepID=A0A1G5IY42_9BACT|nr:flagellar export protein FliJ [Desulfoluna spongiiphila]SCY80630.1 flagellar export protein FliJ [Desulfoluna spongiiphila]VVS93270.1 flagellar export flij [Desulfoluna spongiiphila]